MLFVFTPSLVFLDQVWHRCYPYQPWIFVMGHDERNQFVPILMSSIDFVLIYRYQLHLYLQLFRDAPMHSNYHLQLEGLQHFSSLIFLYFLILRQHESKR
jgi:hypothetical protein